MSTRLDRASDPLGPAKRGAIDGETDYGFGHAVRYVVEDADAWAEYAAAYTEAASARIPVQLENHREYRLGIR